jgi:hypothetical protein
MPAAGNLMRAVEVALDGGPGGPTRGACIAAMPLTRLCAYARNKVDVRRSALGCEPLRKHGLATGRATRLTSALAHRGRDAAATQGRRERERHMETEAEESAEPQHPDTGEAEANEGTGGGGGKRQRGSRRNQR